MPRQAACRCSDRKLLVAAHPEVEARSLLEPDPPGDPEARLDAVVAGLAEIFLGAEESYRSVLRLSLVTLTDLAGLSRERAVEVMRWSARALLRAALAEAGEEASG